MNLLILGLGYTAAHFAAHHAGAFDAVTATRRAPQGQSSGSVKLLPCDSSADQVDPRLLAALSKGSNLIGPDRCSCGGRLVAVTTSKAPA